jgi:Ca2+-binding RTX toxin-like protein
VRSSIDGGPGNDRIKATSGAVSTVQGGDGDDTITAIIMRGKAEIHCGPGVDTVVESAYAGNRKRVKIAGDCEKRKRG